MEEDVAGLDIAVHDVVADEHLEGLEEVLEVAECPFLDQVFGLFDEILEGATVTKFIDEVDIVDGLEYLNKLNDVGGVLYLGECLDFVDGEFF
jgi:hypothetical protein